MRKQRPVKKERLASASRAAVALFICFMMGFYTRSRRFALDLVRIAPKPMRIIAHRVLGISELFL